MPSVASQCNILDAVHPPANPTTGTRSRSHDLLIPQSLGVMYQLSRAEVPFALLDEVVTEISTADIYSSAQELAHAASELLAELTGATPSVSQQAVMAAKEAIVTSIAAAALDSGPSNTFYCCSRTSTVGRGMLHASRISHAIFEDAGWRMHQSRCRLESDRNRWPLAFLNRVRRSTSVARRPRVSVRQAHSSDVVLISTGSDLDRQERMLAQHLRQPISIIDLRMPDESVESTHPYVDSARQEVARLSDETIRGHLGAIGIMPLSTRAGRALLEDLAAHMLVVSDLTAQSLVGLEPYISPSSHVLIGRGTHARRTLAENLYMENVRTASLPHGVGEIQAICPRNLDANVFYLPYAMDEPVGQLDASARFYDDNFLASVAESWSFDASGHLLVMSDVPIGGSWPTWSWGVPEYGRALSAVEKTFSARKSPLFMRERPSDPNSLGLWTAQRYAVPVERTQRPPKAFAHLIGIGYSGSLLIEAAFAGRTCTSVIGRPVRRQAASASKASAALIERLEVPAEQEGPAVIDAFFSNSRSRPASRLDSVDASFGPLSQYLAGK